jgi:hypothetical protein
MPRWLVNVTAIHDTKERSTLHGQRLVLCTEIVVVVVYSDTSQMHPVWAAQKWVFRVG